MTRRTAYPPGQRGRRILWRTVTLTLFAGIVALAIGLSDWWHWNIELTMALFAIPYWGIVTRVWLRHGPYMPRLHGEWDQDEDGEDTGTPGA